MKFFSVNAMLESIAAGQANPDQWSGPFKTTRVVRLCDYVALGLDETFTHEGNNAGGKAKAATRQFNTGNRQVHKDLVLGSVNDILNRTGDGKGAKMFGYKAPISMTLVPRIPAKFNVDFASRSRFIESCPSVQDNIGAMLKLASPHKDSIRATDSDYPELDISSVLDLSQLNRDSEYRKGKGEYLKKNIAIPFDEILDSYLRDKNDTETIDEIEIGIVVDKQVEYISVPFKQSEFQGAGIINRHEDSKQLDPVADNPTNVEKAAKLLSAIYNAKPSDFEGKSNESIDKAFAAYQALGVPEDGDIFLSASEIETFLALFDFFAVGLEGRKKESTFSDRLIQGMETIRGPLSKGSTIDPSDIPSVIKNGNYDLYIGYGESTDKSNAEVFNSRKDVLYAGYITNFEGQGSNKDAVIPVYMIAKDDDASKTLTKAKQYSRVYIPSLRGSSTVVEKAYNIDNGPAGAKTIDGIEIFQLPKAIYTQMRTNKAVSKNANNATTNTATAKPEDVISADQTASIEEPVVDETPTEPTVEPQVDAPEDEPEDVITADDPNDEMYKLYSESLKEDDINKFVKKIKAKFKPQPDSPEMDKAMSLIARFADDVGVPFREKVFSNYLSGTLAPKQQAPKASPKVEISMATRGLRNQLLRDNTKLGQGALATVNEILKGGVKLSQEEIDSLVNRGLPKPSIDALISKYSPKMEARVSKVSFSLKALLENARKVK